MSEKWFQRTAADYAKGFSNLLPTGLAWPRDPNSVLQKVVKGLAGIWGNPVESLAALLLTRESDPRSTIILLPDWERAFGLPDECLAEPLTIADRQKALVTRMTLLGAQSRQFFYDQADALGYEISIREYAPFMAGISRCGDTKALYDNKYYRWEIGPPEMRYYWTVQVTAKRYSWFRASSGQAGIDPHLRIGIATDLECIFHRWKPSHTDLTFDYSPLTSVDYSNPYDSFYMMLGIP